MKIAHFNPHNSRKKLVPLDEHSNQLNKQNIEEMKPSLFLLSKRRSRKNNLGIYLNNIKTNGDTNKDYIKEDGQINKKIEVNTGTSFNKKQKMNRCRSKDDEIKKCFMKNSYFQSAKRQNRLPKRKESSIQKEDDSQNILSYSQWVKSQIGSKKINFKNKNQWLNKYQNCDDECNHTNPRIPNEQKLNSSQNSNKKFDELNYHDYVCAEDIQMGEYKFV